MLVSSHPTPSILGDPWKSDKKWINCCWCLSSKKRKEKKKGKKKKGGEKKSLEPKYAQSPAQGIAWGNVKGQGNDEVQAEQHGALEVVGPAVLHSIGDDHDGEGKGNRLEGLEMERHGLVEDGPAENDEERGDEEGDLDAGADGDAHGEVHLVPDGDDDGGDVFGGVSDNGDEDQADEVAADPGGLDDVVDASNEVVGTDGDEDGGDDENEAGGDGTHDGNFGLFVGVLVLRVKEVVVGSELEPEVHDVEKEEDDGGASRKE